MTAAGFAVAAAAGALVRWQAGERLPAPLGTLAVNLVGAFALGLLAGASEATRTVAGVGLLGSMTTFSTVMVELDGLWGRRKEWAITYGALTFAGGVAAAWLGLQLS